MKDNGSSISFSVAENNSGASRTGKITLSYGGVSKVFTVTQTYSASSISLTPTSGSHDYTSGTYTFKYTVSNPREGQKATVTSSDSWITSVIDSNGTVSYMVTENNSGSARTGKITVTYGGVSKDFAVTQSYSAASLSLSPTSASHDYTSATYTFNYTVSNPREGQKATVSTSDSWITSVTDSNGTVSYKVSRNTTGSSRSGKITVKYGDQSNVFTITQSAASLTLSSSSATCTYASVSKSFSITIPNRQSDLAVSVKSNVTWITGVSESSGTVSYAVAENNSGSSRTGKITVTYAGVSKEFTVTQSYSATSLSLSPTSASHDYTSATYTFKYTILNPREGQKATVSTTDSWITGVTDNNGTVSYTVAENNSGSSRTGKITVAYAGVSKDFTVSQSYSAVSLSLSPTSASHDYTSGTYTFNYTVSNPREGQKATVSTSDSWITGVSESNGTVSYAVAENNSGLSRTGKITVTYAGISEEFLVVQMEKLEDLSLNGAANSYVVSKTGSYCFKSVKGNSSTSVGTVSSVVVLWESFGTSTTPSVGDLIKSVSSKNGNIYFDTATTFKEGNAVIAAKDASGKILWSWHIWFTDQPKGQAYYNNAGTMMDRNLGATSATPSDVGALGLLYQWGRKDPFLGSSSISSSVEAKSTITWPSNVSSNSSNGTIAYATSHPTTFIAYNRNNYDWYYTGTSSTDNTRWTTSGTSKSIYDPCPAGWRVPDGGSKGVWSKAKGSYSSFGNTYDSTNEGMDFSGIFGDAATIWCPASGCRHGDVGSLSSVGSNGFYWSASPNSYNAYYLYFYYLGDVVDPSGINFRAEGCSVRCVRESN